MTEVLQRGLMEALRICKRMKISLERKLRAHFVTMLVYNHGQRSTAHSERLLCRDQYRETLILAYIRTQVAELFQSEPLGGFW